MTQLELIDKIKKCQLKKKLKFLNLLHDLLNKTSNTIIETKD